MIKILGLICLFSQISWGQDQREIIDMLSQSSVSNPVQFNFAMRPFYLDINGNGELEKIELSKRDGRDWISIFRSSEKVFEHELQSYAGNSHIFRLRRKKLATGESLLTIFYYDGQRPLINYRASARLYLLSFSDDLKNFWLSKGPSIWDEQELPFYQHYHKRSYGVSFADMNKDGMTDVTVNYRGTSRVMIYLGEGRWINL